MNSHRRRWGSRILATVSAIIIGATVAPSVAVGQPQDSPITSALSATGIVPSNAIKDHGEVDENNLNSSTNPKCADIIMIGIPGTFEINQNADPNQPNGLLGKMAAPLRDQDWFSETYINYVSDAGVNGTSYAQSVDGGVRKTLATLKDIQNRCGDSQVFLTGFSQGADIAGDVATLIGNKATDIEAGRIAGVTLFADPQRSSGSNTIADTPRDLPVLPLPIQEAVDNFVNDQSLAQVQMGLADAADLAEDVGNAFGVGGRGSEPRVRSSDSPTTAPKTTSEKPSRPSDDRSSSKGTSDEPSDESGEDGGSSNLFGTEMLLSSHGTVGSSSPTPSFSHAVADTSSRTSLQTVSDDNSATAELIEKSSLGKTLSDDDKKALADSMATSQGSADEQEPEQRSARQSLRAAAYMTGLFVKSTLAGMEAGSSADAELLKAMDNESLELLTGFTPNSEVEPIPEDQQSAVETRCRTLRFNDCVEEVEEAPQRSQEVSDTQFASAVSDSARATEYGNEDTEDSDTRTDTDSRDNSSTDSSDAPETTPQSPDSEESEDDKGPAADSSPDSGPANPAENDDSGSTSDDLPESSDSDSDGAVGSSVEDDSSESDADHLAGLWSGTTTNTDGGQLTSSDDDESATEDDSDAEDSSSRDDSEDSSDASENQDEGQQSSGDGGASSSTDRKASTEDVNIDRVTQQGVAGGGLVGERDQGFGVLTGRVAQLCAPGDLVCDLAPNSELAQKLVQVGQEFSIDASEVSDSVATGDTEGLTRMGGLLAVQAVAQVAELSGLPAPKLSADSVTALIKIAAGAALVANGDPTGAGVAMIASTMDDLPTVLPELAAQIGDIPAILEALPQAGDTAAKNLGLEDLQKKLSGAFEKAKIGDVTDLAELPEATTGLIGDLLENNEGLLEMATNPTYYQNAHSVAGFTKLKLAGGTDAMQWAADWMRQVDEQEPSKATSDNVNTDSPGSFRPSASTDSDDEKKSSTPTTSSESTATPSIDPAASSSRKQADRVVLLGDSTSVSIKDQLEDGFTDAGYKDAKVDAIESAFVTNGDTSGLARIPKYKKNGEQSDWVIALGVNGAAGISQDDAADQISQIMEELKDQGTVYWPQIAVGSSGEMIASNGGAETLDSGVSAFNDALAAAAKDYDNLEVVDWDPSDEAFSDGVHYTAEGSAQRAEMITSAVSSTGDSPTKSRESKSSAPAVSQDSVWDKLAECEAGGDWSINTGNGFSGGLQFTDQTWKGAGGEKYAAVAHEASREEQIAVAEKVKEEQGWGAWPACTSKLGLR